MVCVCEREMGVFVVCVYVCVFERDGGVCGVCVACERDWGVCGVCMGGRGMCVGRGGVPACVSGASRSSVHKPPSKPKVLLRVYMRHSKPKHIAYNK